MKTKDRDPQSHFAIVDSFLKQADLDQEEYLVLTNELKRYLDLKLNRGFIHPMITKFSTDWYREFYRLIGFKDPYKKLKDLSNEKAGAILPTLTVNSFEEAVKLSVAGNILDYGSVLVLNPELYNIAHEITQFKNLSLSIDDIEKLQDDIKNAKTILFLPDNAGECIFDIPLLEYINKHLPSYRVFIGAKSSPMLNDVTSQELRDLGFDKYGTIIPTGSNGFGLHEEDTSFEFKRILHDVDLIIAKGQAYMEFFTEYNFKNAYNLTRVKYPIINAALGTLDYHQNVVVSSNRYAHTGKAYKFGSLHPKIIEKEKLADVIKSLRSQGKSIVTANGSFDILHVGHIRTFENAKRQGDVLIVGLNSDSSIRQYKSPYRPINPEQHRAEFLASLHSIDYVTIFDETDPIALLSLIKPDVHCNGSEYGEKCIEAETVKEYGGRIHIMPPIDGFSTSAMINKCVKVRQLEEKLHEQSGEHTPPTKFDIKTMRDSILSTIKSQSGILFAKPALVHREAYCGRGIIAKNTKFEPSYTDDRGYLPVEWWVMSTIQAENEINKPLEGITHVLIEGVPTPLTKVLQYVQKEIFGEFQDSWPLTKILDIGGEPVTPSFSKTREVPPIPVHVHPGYVQNGKIIPPGKTEAYFFPPVDIAPYNQNFGPTITRLGLKPDITKEEFIDALEKYGKDDSMYSICNTYDIKANDGWTIPSGIVHAPGPWITFEIQRPQDDFHLLSWQLGSRLDNETKQEHTKRMQLRGLANYQDLVDQAIDWKTSTDPQFKNKFYRPSTIISTGDWGTRSQIFFDMFYGEAIEMNPNSQITLPISNQPYAGIVWSGKGLINNNRLDVDNELAKEFLITPNTEVTIQNEENKKLLIYTVYPQRK